MIPCYCISPRSRTWKLLALCLALAACLSFARPASAGIVVNGDFETGNFTGWTQSGDTRFTGVGNAATLAGLGGSVHSGDFAAFFGPPTLGFITQSLPTTPGATYVLDFWLAHPFTELPGQGVEWLVRVGGDTLLDSHDTPNFDYREFTFTFTATSASTDLQFGFAEPAASFFLDDVSANVPEPGSCILLGVGAAMLFGYSRLRRKSART